MTVCMCSPLFDFPAAFDLPAAVFCHCVACRLHTSTPHAETRSDFFKPQAMSFTRGLKLINCDRDILLRLDWQDSGSYRQFNWIDSDGTASGRGTRTVMAPALPDNWWKVGNNNCTLQVGAPPVQCCLPALLTIINDIALSVTHFTSMHVVLVA